MAETRVRGRSGGHRGPSGATGTQVSAGSGDLSSQPRGGVRGRAQGGRRGEPEVGVKRNTGQTVPFKREKVLGWQGSPPAWAVGFVKCLRQSREAPPPAAAGPSWRAGPAGSRREPHPPARRGPTPLTGSPRGPALRHTEP